MMHKFGVLHKLTTLYWIPGCTVHLPGNRKSYHFVVVLQVDVVAFKVLTYMIRLDEMAGWGLSSALIDLKQSSRAWLWKADRQNLAEQTACVVRVQGVTRLDYDTIGPWRVVRTLSGAKFATLNEKLMKGFYDLKPQHLDKLHRTTYIPNTILLQRIDNAIDYVNDAFIGSSSPHI
ncbi:hypothetical protein [Pseudomonas sp. WHRI 8519]|uniref:hypothetical protein n=1 Tax=Pseudomonas sp. WHRI 8519 TaxID=3162567 RepID=UPI0032EC0637